MPTYTINGKRIKTDTQLTDEQIDEIAADLAKESASAPSAPTPQPAPAAAPAAAPAPAPVETTAAAPAADSVSVHTQNLLQWPAEVSGEAPVKAPGAGRSLLEELGRQAGLTARAGVKGLTSIPAAAGDLLMQGASALTGKQLPTTTQSIDALLNRLGVPQPENALERAVQAGVSGMANPVGMTGNLPKVALAGAGAGMGSQVASEQAEQEGLNPLQSAGISLLGGIVGGITGAKTVGAGSSLNSWFANTSLGKSMGAKAAAKPLTTKDLRDVASKAYKDVEAKGVTIRPLAAENLVNRVEKTLVDKHNFLPDIDAARPVGSAFNHMRQTLSDPDIATNGLSMSQLDKMRSSLVAQARESTDEQTRNFARKAIAAFDDEVAMLKPSNLRGGTASDLADVKSKLVEARGAYRRLSKAETIDELVNKALIKVDGAQGKLGMGEALVTEFKSFLLKKDNLRGFSEEEIKQMRRVVAGDQKVIDTLLSQIARLNPMKGGGAGMLTAGTLYVNPQAGAILAGTAMASGATLTALKQAAVKQLQQDILSGKVTRPTNEAAMKALLETYIANQREQNNGVEAPL